jgi:hypothetical protein
MLCKGLCAAVATSFVLGGCANSQPFSSGFAGPAQAAEVEQDPAQKTMASKVLSAIALERVTGAKPDPTRLGER